MDTLQNLRKELKQEYETTKKFLNIYPEDKNDYTPHEKSMNMMLLANHLVEIFDWPAMMINTEKLDFAAGDYQPNHFTTKAELLHKLEDGFKNSTEKLSMINEGDLTGSWTINNGEQLIASFNKYEAIRHSFNQINHHRAQLGIYYRLNDIDLPGSYGPSSDDENF